jgi:hypothetical protein
MKRIRILGLVIMAAFALSAVAASAALAVEATEPVFEFTGSGANKNKFKGTSPAGTLETVNGSKIKCTSDTSVGFAKASGNENVEKVVVTFTGCETLTKKCTTAGKPIGTIETNKLEGELGYLNEKNDPTEPEEEIGLELKPEPPATEFAAFTCGTISVKVKGTIIGTITPIDKLVKTTEHFTLTFAQTSGKQKFTSFVGDVSDGTLESNLGLGYEQAGIATTAEISPEEGEWKIKDDAT